MTGSVRIIGAPAGAAPLWVREQWIGLELPIDPPHVVEMRVWTDFSLKGPLTPWMALLGWLTGKLSTWKGYVVDVDTAVSILSIKHPEAAAWWRENVPHMMGKTFIFDEPACKPVWPGEG